MSVGRWARGLGIVPPNSSLPLPHPACWALSGMLYDECLLFISHVSLCGSYSTCEHEGAIFSKAWHYLSINVVVVAVLWGAWLGWAFELAVRGWRDPPPPPDY